MRLRREILRRLRMTEARDSALGSAVDATFPITHARIMTPTRRQTVLGYVVLPHAVPVIAVLLATAAFALVAARDWTRFADFFCLLGAMFGAQLAIGAVNELVDADLDTAAKPD